jgi:hypothetical protein
MKLKELQKNSTSLQLEIRNLKLKENEAERTKNYSPFFLFYLLLEFLPSKDHWVARPPSSKVECN